MGLLWRDTHLIHLSKSLVNEPPSRFPSGAPMERDACHQSLLHKLQGPQYCSPPPGSLHKVPIEKDALFTEPSFNYLSEILVNGLPMILNRATVEKGAHLQNLLTSPVNEHPAKIPSGPPTVSDFCSRGLLPYPSGSPEKEPSSRFP